MTYVLFASLFLGGGGELLTIGSSVCVYVCVNCHFHLALPMSLTFVWEEKPISTCVNNTLEAWGGRLKWIFPEIGDLTSLRSSKNRPMTTCPFFIHPLSLPLSEHLVPTANTLEKFVLPWYETRENPVKPYKNRNLTPHDTSFSKIKCPVKPESSLVRSLKRVPLFHTSMTDS